MALPNKSSREAVERTIEAFEAFQQRLAGAAAYVASIRARVAGASAR